MWMENNCYWKFIVSLQFSSVAQSCLTLCDPMDCSMPGFPVHHQLLELTQTHVCWVDDAMQPSSAVVSFSSHIQSFPASGSFPVSKFFASGGQVLEFQLQHQSFQWISGLISFRMDWFCLLAVQGTLKSLLQHCSSKGLILWCPAFFMSNSHIHTWLLEKNIALARWTFDGKVMSLIFSMFSRFVIAFLPSGKHLLISWLQSLQWFWSPPK